MTPCANCHYQHARPRGRLCWACYAYQRRTGQPRPHHLILRHANRIIDRATTTV